jgi:hypothetical protein
VRAAAFLLPVIMLMAVGCGGSGPGPTPPPPPPPPPPANNPPIIDAITAQGLRPRQPANFADLGESIAVTARVRDDETAVEQVQFVWTATAGSFSGSGANVTWQAPASVGGGTPSPVTLTLTVTEKYGSPGAALSYEHTVMKSAPVALHDSIREVAEMSRQFLLDFSTTSIKDADYIMRNFGNAATCPDAIEVQREREDVIRNYTFFNILNFRVDTPAVTVNFGGVCPFRGKRGDACSVTAVLWDSIDTRINVRGTTSGNDIIAAAYSTSTARWWLCASDYQGSGSFASHFGR